MLAYIAPTFLMLTVLVINLYPTLCFPPKEGLNCILPVFTIPSTLELYELSIRYTAINLLCPKLIYKDF